MSLVKAVMSNINDLLYSLSFIPTMFVQVARVATGLGVFSLNVGQTGLNAQLANNEIENLIIRL